MRKIPVSIALLLVLLSSAATLVFAQTNGQVGGVVQDPSKALIPGVTVTLTNTETGITVTQLTNESGVYNFASVAPGNAYRVTAALSGFKTSVTSGVQVGTSAQVRLDLTLGVGTSDSKVEVTESALEVMTNSAASVGDVLTAQRAVDLPLIGNDVLDLVKVLPGYRAFPQFDTPGVAVYAVFAGQTSNTVNVTRDGLSVTDGRNNANTFGISTTTNINPELIGEIRLILAPVDAELGRGNTQIQVQTRSGTNKYTGSAVWNVQNSALNANSWANNKATAVVNGVTVWSPTKPDWRNTHDVTITYGGPIVKNKTFFFAAWEQQISKTRALQTNSVYTDSARQGIFRYWEKWNPGNALSAAPVFPASATAATAPSVDSAGTPIFPGITALRPTGSNPDGSAYSGVLRCFSIFGNVKADGSPFTQADCPNGFAVTNSVPWDTNRPGMDSTGYIAKILSKMPRANYFGTGDGLNTAGFQWVRGTSGQGGANAAAGVSPFVNRKQINIKIDENIGKHRISGSWSYQHDDSADFVASWPGGLNGATRRRPQVFTLTGTSTISSRMVNEARFGLRYQVTGRFIAAENPLIQAATKEWYLDGGMNANGTIYPVAFNPAGIGNGYISITSQSSGDTTPLYDYADTLSWSLGKHALKFGADFRRASSNGYNSTGGSVLPNVSGGASTGLTSILANTDTTGIFANNQLINFLQTARSASANLLYFMNASVASASQLYWIDNASDLTNATWQDLATRQKKYRDQHSTEWSLFWKDDWKLTSGLTLNLGLRYDYYGSPYIGSGFTSASVGLGAGLFGNSRVSSGGLFDKWLTPGNTYLTGYGSNVSGANALVCTTGATQAGVVDSLGNPIVSNCDPNALTQIEFVGPNTPNPRKVVIPVDKNNFGPAIGFAWQVPWFGEGKTAVRGGYQVTFSGTHDSSTLDTLLGSAPGNTLSSTTQITDANIACILNGTICPNGSSGAPRALNLSDLAALVPVRPTNNPGATVPIYGRTGSFQAYDQNFRTPYIENITMQVTRSLTHNMTLDLRYVSTLGRKLEDTINLNFATVFDNPELLQALDTTRAGGDAPLFDLMFAGLDLHGNTGTGYGAVGTCSAVAGAPGGEGCPAGQVRQHGSAQLRRNSTFTSNLANGNYVGVINSLANLSTVNSGLQAAPSGVTGLNARILRNGCDRLANNLYNPTLAASATNIPTRCFPEDYFYANPQFNNGVAFGSGSPVYHGNLTHNNYHSLQVQHTLRPTQGSSLQTTYTWAKLMSDNYNTFVDPRNRHADYSLDYASVPTELRMNGTFELPLGPNKLFFGNSTGAVARALEKWQTSIVYNWGSGQPRDTFTAQHLYAGGGGNQPQARPDIVGPWFDPKTEFKQNGPNNATGTIYGYPSPYAVFPDPQCINNVAATDTMGFNLQTSCTLNGLAHVVPAGTPGAIALAATAPDGSPLYGVPVLQNPMPGKQGTEGARMLRLPGRWFFDANISKAFRISESKSIQIRFDANNILNHPNPGEPIFNVQSPDFGRVTADKVSNNTQRSFQGQLRFSF